MTEQTPRNQRRTRARQFARDLKARRRAEANEVQRLQSRERAVNLAWAIYHGKVFDANTIFA